MKRITAIVLLIFFLIGNSYAAFNIHYCGGKIKSISVAKAKTCEMCGKTSSKPCCNDIQKLVKSDDFSKVTHNWVFKALNNIAAPLFTRYFYVANPKTDSDASHFLISDSSRRETPVYIRIHSLII